MVDFEGREFLFYCVFDSIARPVDGLMAVKFKGKYGVISADEDWILPPQDFSLGCCQCQAICFAPTVKSFCKIIHWEKLSTFTPIPAQILC